MNLREFLTIAALLILIAATYGHMQQADARAAQREQEIWIGKGDK
ncbi:hypothetical protein [Duganella sp. Leaf126]|nr:hypothetical protein [Duganella sp. Leaf126]